MDYTSAGSTLTLVLNYLVWSKLPPPGLDLESEMIIRQSYYPLWHSIYTIFHLVNQSDFIYGSYTSLDTGHTTAVSYVLLDISRVTLYMIICTFMVDLWSIETAMIYLHSDIHRLCWVPNTCIVNNTNIYTDITVVKLFPGFIYPIFYSCFTMPRKTFFKKWLIFSNPNMESLDEIL